MTSILIVGSNSTVGRAIGSFLEGTYDVFYAGRVESDIFLDLEKPSLSFEVNRNFDFVINTAAYFGNDIKLAQNINALGAIHVCEIALRVKAKRLLMISSMSANYQFGDAYFGAYSLTKRHGDELAQLYCKNQNLPITILRPSQLYDADSKCRKHQALFYSIIDRAEQGNNIEFYGSNDALRNLLYLEDFCEIIARTIKLQVSGVFDCPFPQAIKLSQIAKLAYQIFAQGGEFVFNADKPDIANLPSYPQAEIYSYIDYVPSCDSESVIKKIKQSRENV